MSVSSARKRLRKTMARRKLPGHMVKRNGLSVKGPKLKRRKVQKLKKTFKAEAVLRKKQKQRFDEHSVKSGDRSVGGRGGTSLKKQVSFAEETMEIDAGAEPFRVGGAGFSSTPVRSSSIKSILKRRTTGDSFDADRTTLTLNTTTTTDEASSAECSATASGLNDAAAAGRKTPAESADVSDGPAADADSGELSSPSASSTPKKTTTSRRKMHNELKRLRRQRKPNYELVVKAKRLWETVRRKSAPASEREKCVAQLYALVQGRAKELIFAHDSVRVIQCLMALKSQEIRNNLFEELKDHVLEIAKSKYGRFFVIKMLKYGNASQRKNVIQSFYKHIPELLGHTYAADVVEFAYSGYCTALQRYHMVSEFYGPRFWVFKGEKVESLKTVLEAEPSTKDHLLKNLKERLLALTLKPVLINSISHRLFREFLDVCDENDRKEIVEAMQDHVMELVHTKDGVIVAMNCIWFGTAKQRKAIIRSMKTLVKKICLDEYGHMFLSAVFDSVDDTTLVNFVIIKEIVADMKEIAGNKYGIKVLLYLLSPRNKCYFMAETITLLSTGDGNPHSKKDKSQRYSELLTSISPALISYAAEHAVTMVQDVKQFSLLASICECAIGAKRVLYESLASVVVENLCHCIPGKNSLETSYVSFLLGRVIKHDREVHALGEDTFAECLVQRLSVENLKVFLASNRGAFLLVHLFETNVPSVQEAIRKFFLTCNVSKQKENAGIKLLRQKLSGEVNSESV